MYQEVILFLIGCIALVVSAEFIIKSASHLARYLHFTEFATSFLLVAFVSSLPEAFISIFSALRGDPGLGLGTLLGSNIADLTIILGLVALAGHPLRIHSSIIRKDLYFAALTLLPILLGLDGIISRIDAVILLIAGLAFIFVLVSERKYFHKPYRNGSDFFKHASIFFISTPILLLSAHLVVTNTHLLALELNVSSLMIGLLLTALGTTLPELTFSLRSIRLGHPELAIGDILGVVVVDATIMVAITAFITPIAVNLFLFSIIGIFTAFAITFALLFMRTDSALTRNEAIALIFFYISFVVVQIFLR